MKEDVCYVLTVEHFSGNLKEVIGVFTDLEMAKVIQREYDSFNRIYVTIYRSTLHAENKNEAKPKTRAKKKGNGATSKEKRPD